MSVLKNQVLFLIVFIEPATEGIFNFEKQNLQFMRLVFNSVENKSFCWAEPMKDKLPNSHWLY